MKENNELSRIEKRLLRQPRWFDAPWKISLFSVIVSVLITIPLTYIFFQDTDSILNASAIAITCSLPISYIISKRTQAYTDLVIHKNAVLEAQTAALQASNAELDAFAQTVAHDLKNPLSIIIGYAEMLLDRELTDSSMNRHALRQMNAASIKANEIIVELLLLAQVRKEDIQLEPLNTKEIIAQAKKRLAPLLEEANGTITHPNEWPIAKGHPQWVEEVWVNYMSNALKYGGQPPQLELGADEVNSAIRFWVQDNGAGIDPKDQQRLFTEFTRLHKSRAEGTGLGLSIVQRIVNKLDGEIGVESQLGEGSRFYFTLPKGS